MLENSILELSSVVQLRQLVLLSTRGILVQEFPSLPWEALEKLFFISLTSWVEAKAFIFSYCIIILGRNVGVAGVVVRIHHHPFPEIVLWRRSSLFLQEIKKGYFQSSITYFGIGPYVSSHAQRSLFPLQCYLQKRHTQGVHIVHQRVKYSVRGVAFHLEYHWRR